MQHIYNKGKRTWTIETGFDKEGNIKNTVVLEPERSVELPDKIAEKYTTRYPKDLIFGQGAQSRPSGALKARVAELEAENARLKSMLAESGIELEPEKQEKEKAPTKEQLINDAKLLGIEVDKRWGVEKLQEVINESLQSGK